MKTFTHQPHPSSSSKSTYHVVHAFKTFPQKIYEILKFFGYVLSYFNENFFEILKFLDVSKFHSYSHNPFTTVLLLRVLPETEFEVELEG